MICAQARFKLVLSIVEIELPINLRAAVKNNKLLDVITCWYLWGQSISVQISGKYCRCLCMCLFFAQSLRRKPNWNFIFHWFSSKRATVIEFRSTKRTPRCRIQRMTLTFRRLPTVRRFGSIIHLLVHLYLLRIKVYYFQVHVLLLL